MNRGRSAAALKALRRKYKLGEFRTAKTMTTPNGGWHYKKVHGNRYGRKAMKSRPKTSRKSNPWSNMVRRYSTASSNAGRYIFTES